MVEPISLRLKTVFGLIFSLKMLEVGLVVYEIYLAISNNSEENLVIYSLVLSLWIGVSTMVLTLKRLYFYFICSNNNMAKLDYILSIAGFLFFGIILLIQFLYKLFSVKHLSEEESITQIFDIKKSPSILSQSWVGMGFMSSKIISFVLIHFFNKWMTVNDSDQLSDANEREPLLGNRN